MGKALGARDIFIKYILNKTRAIENFFVCDFRYNLSIYSFGKLSIAALVAGLLMFLVYFVLYLRMIFFQNARAMTPVESASVPV